MILPDSIPRSIKCPTCMPFDDCNEQLSKLEWQKYPFRISEHLSYYCDNCKSNSTTIESDTISLRNHISKKRSLLRKDKIKRIM